MKKIIRQVGLLAVLLCSVLSLSAKDKDLNPEQELKKYQALYPEEQAIFLEYYEDIKLTVEGDQLRIHSDHREVVLYLGDNATMFAKDKIYTSSFTKVQAISASTLIPNKKKYKAIEVTDFKESFDNRSSVFYDDSKFIKFTYPGVQKGAKSILEYQEEITQPHFLGTFFFQSYMPVHHAKITITTDKSVDLGFVPFNLEEGKFSRKVEEKEGKVVYTYEMNKVPKARYESNSPSFNYHAPHLSCRIKSYQTSSGEKVDVLHDLSGLFAWYQTFIKDLKSAPSPELKAVVEKLVSPDDTELQKVKKIFYWVQKNIKYIAFEDGMRGFIPHNGQYVCEKRYGDCKDMSSIIVNMLHHAGIEAYFTWIGSRDLPYRYSELPTPSVDNHMIACYIADGKHYFLDATGQYLPFGFPTSMIQGKEALIALGKEKYEVFEVPEVSKENNTFSDTTTIALEKGAIKGTGHYSMEGFAKVFNAYRGIKSDKKDTDKYIQNLLAKGNNKFFIDQYKVENLDAFDLPTSIRYEFRIEDYYKEVGNDLYVNLNLNTSYSGDYIEEDRISPFEKEYKFTDQSVTTMQIPEGYKVKFLPENVTHSGDIFGFQTTYEQNGDQIIVHKSYYINRLMIEPEDFANWNDSVRKYSDSNRQVVILTKK